jgi:hypothetical protein
MKTISFIILTILLSFSVLAFAIDIPPPFEKIKEWAMLEKPDQDGDYINRIVVIENGEEIEFVLGWLKSSNIIGISQSNYAAFLYEVDTQKFYVFYGGYLSQIENQKATEGAYTIFRELINRSLI